MFTIAIRTSNEYFSQNPPTKIRKKYRFCKLLKIFLQKNIFIAIKFAYIDIFFILLLRFFANLTTCNTPNTNLRARCEDSACRYRIMIRIKKNSEIVIERGCAKYDTPSLLILTRQRNDNPPIKPRWNSTFLRKKGIFRRFCRNYLHI